MSTIFEKNIIALKEKNSNLADKLLKHFPTEVPQLVKTDSGYNFLYKNHLLHNQISPLGEAKEIFSMAKNEPVAIHLVFGLGLGYLFQVASANSQGSVILYEPDLNILKIAFSLVDFSADIRKPNVFIANTLEETESYIHQKSNMKNTPLMLSTNAYRELYGQKFDDLVKELQQSIGRFGLDLKYTKEHFYPLLSRIIENIPNLLKETPLAEIKDTFKNKTAVVVSAGPSLDKNIETIKKYRDKIVLIVVGTAMKAISQNGIKPDFLCIIESFDCSKQIEGLDLSEVNFITEPFSNPELRKRKFKNIYLHSSSNFPVNSFWCDIAGISNSEYISKGTVSYTALNTARILGCSKIVLVGQDLAYIEGQCYSKDSAYKDLVCKFNQENNRWEITANDIDAFANALSNAPDIETRRNVASDRLKNLNSSLYYVKSIKGEMIPTESVYAAFIKPLSEFTEMFPNIKYINTSLVGAQIDGFENLPLEEALKDSQCIESKDLKKDFHYDVQKIKDNLFKSKEELKSALLITEEIIKIANSIHNNLTLRRAVNEEILKSLKKLSLGYYTLSVDFASKNKLFDFITAAEKIDTDYAMKMTKELTLENIKNLTDSIKNYAVQANDKINNVSDLISRVIENVN